MKDYLAMRRQEPGDKLDHGILGMRWGRRRTEAQLKKAIATRKAAGEDVTPTKKAAAIEPASSGPETSIQRYSRLHGEAKGGGQKTWSDEDLKFYNSRTEALAKVNKMHETNPGWLSTTSKKVLQNAAQRTMQDITNGVANKYITAPLLDAITDNSKAIAAESKTPVDYVGRHRTKKK